MFYLMMHSTHFIYYLTVNDHSNSGNRKMGNILCIVQGKAGYSCGRAFAFGSILHGPTVNLFHIPANGSQLVFQRPWCVLSCLWDSAYKRTIAANRNE